MRRTYLFIVLILVLVCTRPNYTEAVTVTVTASVPGCGDHVINVGEQCDGSNLGGASCVSRGFGGGTISCSTACTFNVSGCSASGGGGGGGGGGTEPLPMTNIVVTGRAYPLSKVFVLKDGQLALTTIAGPDSLFSGTISGLSTGHYNISVYGEDSAGRRSSSFTFPVYLTTNATTQISGIFISPTIALDKSAVKKGDTISIFGQSTPGASMVVSVHSPTEYFLSQKADPEGAYLLNFDTSVLDLGDHAAKSKATLGNEVSDFGRSLGFIVGLENVTTPSDSSLIADLNKDGKVNLIDFSILAYWYKRPTPPIAYDLNKDGKIDLIDFSIMAFHWTG